MLPLSPQILPAVKPIQRANTHLILRITSNRKKKVCWTGTQKTHKRGQNDKWRRKELLRGCSHAFLCYLVTVQCRKETNRQSLRDTYAVSSRSQRKMTEMFLLTLHMPPTSKNRLCFCVRFAYTCYYMYVEGSHICKSFCPELENLG